MVVVRSEEDRRRRSAMKMKKLTAIAMVALLGSLAANATVVFNDTFTGTSGVLLSDLSVNNLVARQAGGTTSSTYTIGGTANSSGALYGDLYSYQVMTSAAGGDHVTMDLDTDFGSSLAGNQWSISYIELSQSDGGPGNWGGWAGLFIGSTRGFGTELGVLFRPDGAWSVFNGFTELHAGAAGELVGEDAISSVNVAFDEVANTVSVSQGTFDMGTYPMAFAGGSRFVQFRTHWDGGNGTSTTLDTLQDDVTITVIPEPATLGLFALVGGGMLWIRKRMI